MKTPQEWIEYYRDNPEKFAEEYLTDLQPFQKEMLKILSKQFIMSSRGISKTRLQYELLRTVYPELPPWE